MTLLWKPLPPLAFLPLFGSRAWWAESVHLDIDSYHFVFEEDIQIYASDSEQVANFVAYLVKNVLYIQEDKGNYKIKLFKIVYWMPTVFQVSGNCCSEYLKQTDLYE